jgi:hypothetical protein
MLQFFVNFENEEKINEKESKNDNKALFGKSNSKSNITM